MFDHFRLKGLLVEPQVWGSSPNSINGSSSMFGRFQIMMNGKNRDGRTGWNFSLPSIFWGGNDDSLKSQVGLFCLAPVCFLSMEYCLRV